MAKKPQQNKIGESFEQQLPNELVPGFIWDNISTTLDSSKTPIESTEKIKASFEEGFNKEMVPPLLWNGIQSSLEQTSSFTPLTEVNNKIKTSFEAGHQDPLPENLWENVENQLEIEGVWQRVLKGLNKRTKTRYWQEKGIQFGILALAILLLRGCDFGDGLNPTPVANQSNTFAKVELGAQESTPISTLNPKVANSSASNANKTTSSSNNHLSEPTYTLPTTPIFSEFSSTPSTANSKIITPVVAKNSKKFSPTSLTGVTIPVVQQNSDSKENLTTNSVKKTLVAIEKTSSTYKSENKTTSSPTNSILTSKDLNTSNEVEDQFLVATKRNSVTTNESTLNKNLPSTTALSNNSIDPVLNTPLDNKIFFSSKRLLSQIPISTLTGQPVVDPTIEELNAFEIHTITNSKKKHNIRFELGMNGKVGTSLLLGNATNKAMETTSMVKTKTRAAGGIGILFDCYLTANDAIVFGAYPLSSSQQYFGGYTNEGRYYHKEVKLAYFDFTLGYQRTLFHYNDFGTVPSSMYARLDYGLGYLSKSEEIINGLASELGDSYNKLNHNIGLTIGNTHRINRFVIDYGIYGNIGLSSVLNVGPSGTSVEYNNLATMGGYLGLRYIL